MFLILIQISLTCADAGKNLENPGMEHQQSMEEPTSQELTVVSISIQSCSFSFYLIHMMSNFERTPNRNIS